jgi:hypothetical protein
MKTTTLLIVGAMTATAAGADLARRLVDGSMPLLDASMIVFGVLLLRYFWDCWKL